MIVDFTGDVWRWQARRDDWWFTNLPTRYTDEIAALSPVRRGWGAVRVTATIGETTWTTSIFPATDRDGAYALPLKRAVREREGVDEGGRVTVHLEIAAG